MLKEKFATLGDKHYLVTTEDEKSIGSMGVRFFETVGDKTIYHLGPEQEIILRRGNFSYVKEGKVTPYYVQLVRMKVDMIVAQEMVRVDWEDTSPDDTRLEMCVL